jgi:hypothetical protein
MFILYAVLVGFLVGLATGGRPVGLATLQFRFAWLVIVGFTAQIVLFSAPVSDRVGSLGPVLYVASTALVFIALLANIRITGLPLVALGAACNLLAIMANGGFMPMSAATRAAFGKGPIEGYSNSAVVVDPVLAPLTDIFALPSWLPFANVFSIGDVLIAGGIAVAVAAAMHRRPAAGTLSST